MDLDFTIPPSRGAKPVDAVAEYRRDLNELDMLTLGQMPDLGSETPNIKSLRASHHELASLLAKGIKAVQASLITGYSQSRISILQKDPAFKELLAYYADINKQVTVDVIERARMMGIDILAILHERILEDHKKMGTGELIKAGEFVLDRSGYGPKSTMKVEHGLSKDTLEAIKRAEDEAVKGEIREAYIHSRPDVCGGDKPALVHKEEAETLIVSSEGIALPAPRGEVHSGTASAGRDPEV